MNERGSQVKRFIVLLLASVLLASCVSASYARVIVRGDSVVKMGEDINMGEGLKFNDLVAIKGNVNVKGTVKGDVVAILGSVHLYPKADVMGDVVTIGGGVIRDAGSKIGGTVNEIPINKEGTGMAAGYIPMMGIMATGGFLMFKVLAFLGFIGLAMIMVSFMTRQIGAVSSMIERQWLKSIIWGILGLILIPLVALLLVITIIGIPLVVIELVIVSLAMTVGYIAIAQLIGKKFTKAIRKPNQPMVVEAIWGLLILFLIDLIPVLGPVIKCVAVIMGFGAAVVTKIGYK